MIETDPVTNLASKVIITHA